MSNRNLTSFEPTSRCGRPIKDAVGRPKVTLVKRSDGHSAVGSIAYITRSRCRDDRTGKLYDFSRQAGMVAFETVGWTEGAEDFANAMEKTELRSNAQVARSWILPLPADLTQTEMHNLGVEYANWLNEKYGTASVVALHSPDDLENGGRNWHLHVIETTRRVITNVHGTQALGEKTREMVDTNGAWCGGPARCRVELWRRRQKSEDLTNEALEKSGIEYRVDFSGYEDQAREGRRAPQEATEHLGRADHAQSRRIEKALRTRTQLPKASPRLLRNLELQFDTLAIRRAFAAALWFDVCKPQNSETAEDEFFWDALRACRHWMRSKPRCRTTTTAKPRPAKLPLNKVAPTSQKLEAARKRRAAITRRMAKLSKTRTKTK